MKMKTVVCVGDSLTRGGVSFNYVDMLSRKMDPDAFKFINAGTNKDLAYNVFQRIDEFIDFRPDFITILIGTNDANASLDEAFAQRAVKKRHLPQKPTPEWFQKNLFEIVSRLKSQTDARIALLSIPPIGEDLNHIGVRRTGEYSRIIKNVAAECNIDYLPIYETMVEELRSHPSTPKTTYDHWRHLVYKSLVLKRLFRRSFDSISESNGFHLLVDFIHLNSKGARIVAEHIEAFFSKE